MRTALLLVLLGAAVCLQVGLCSKGKTRTTKVPATKPRRFRFKTMPTQKKQIQMNEEKLKKIALQLTPNIDSTPNGTVTQSPLAGKPSMENMKKPNGKEGKAKLIIGGTLSFRGQFPWLVAIEIDDQSFCGGSLINPNFVLTAAHCIEGSNNFRLMYGAQNVDQYEQNRITMNAAYAETHRNWDPETLEHDIGLIRAQRRVIYTQLIRPVRLPARSLAQQRLVDKDVLVAGWGRTSDASQSMSSVQYNVQMKVVDIERCLREYNEENIFGTHLCVLGRRNRATCQGDSGGPLMMKEGDGIFTQVGIVSFGASDGCGRGFPDVFTRVTSYLGWISSRTGIYIA